MSASAARLATDFFALDDNDDAEERTGSGAREPARIAFDLIDRGLVALAQPLAAIRDVFTALHDTQLLLAVLDDVTPDRSPAEDGNQALGLHEADFLDAILDAAERVPEAFGTTDPDGHRAPWYTGSLRSELARYRLLRRPGPGHHDGPSPVAHALGVELRQTIMRRFHEARVFVADRPSLRRAMDAVMVDYARGVRRR